MMLILPELVQLMRFLSFPDYDFIYLEGFYI